MKKKLIRYISSLLFVMFMGGIIFTNEVQASSAEIVITADAQEVIVGDKVTVSITITSKEKFSNFEANLTYDDEILEYEGQSGVITGDGGFIRIYDMNHPEGTIKRKYNLTFTVVKAGYGKVQFKDRAVVYSEETEEDMSVSSNQLSIKAVAKATASENGLLGTLEVNPGNLSPSFDKNVKSYEMKVASDVNRLIVYALPEDEKASASVKGNEDLKEGENKVAITVLAESGAVIEYTIHVNKEEAPEETESNNSLLPEDRDTRVEIITENDSSYIVYQGVYEIVEPAVKVEIPEGYTKGTLTISEKSVTAYFPENDLENEFLLVYAKNNLGEESFYQYDRVERTIQRYISREIEPQIIEVVDESKDETIRDYETKLKNFGLAIGIISFVGIILLIANVFQFMKRKGYMK